MKSKVVSIILCGLAISSFAVIANAQYASSQNQNVGPYSSSQTGNEAYDVQNDSYYAPAVRAKHGFGKTKWVDVLPGTPLPKNAIVGGYENGHPLFICHGVFHGGVHPGKVAGQRCNIGFGGREIALSGYQVLKSKNGLGWVPAENGDVPDNALAGGYEHGRPLFVCQAKYRGGVHPGKIIREGCNITWNGREISIPFYNVLVQEA